MKNILYILSIFAFQSFSFGQIAVDVLEHNNSCEGGCYGNVSFEIVNSSDVQVTHFYGSTSVPMNNGSQTFAVAWLCPGNYYFLFEDAAGNIFDTTLTITLVPPFVAELSVSNPNTGSMCDGMLSPVSVSGGSNSLLVMNYFECSDTLAVISMGGDGANLCPGDYFAVVIDLESGCQDTSTCISTQVLSAGSEVSKGLEVTIRQISLQVDKAYDKLKIYNLSGQKVLESSIPDQIIQIDHLATGPYIVSVLKDGEVYNQKIMITEP